MIGNADIAKIARGDGSAFRSLYDALTPRLFYYLHQWMPDRAVCEDILQDAMVMYWDRRHSFSELKAVKIYIFTVARNLLCNHSRVEAGRRRLLTQMFDDLGNDGDDHMLISAELSGVISAAINELPPQTARVIMLCINEYSVPRISEELGISENSVKTLKKAGYRTLRLKLSHLYPILSTLLYIYIYI